VRELHGRGANLEALGRDLLETLRNLAVAKLPQEGQESPFAELPDQELAEIKRLAERASLRDLMRLFRLMAQAQEEILRSPYPDLLLEMAVVRMATIAPVIEADELLRAIGAAEKTLPAVGTAGDKGGGGQSQTGGGVRRIKVEGEVKADAPRKTASESGSREEARELPELRDFIRNKRAALAGFMDQGAGLELDGDVLKIRPRSDIYIRYLSDNRSAIAESASELYGRRITAEVVANGAAATDPYPRVQAQPMRSPTASVAEPARVAAGSESPTVREPTASDQAAGAATGAIAMNPSGDGRSEREAVRRALYADPVVKRIRDQFEGRLVDVRNKPAARARPATGGEEQSDDPKK
jgi:DNA polymerase III gamma/tau subunit